MGYVVITENAKIGTTADPSAPLYGYAGQTTSDGASAAGGVMVTTEGSARYIAVTSLVGAHRVQVNTSSAADADTRFHIVPEGTTREIAIKGGQNFSYRLDA